MKRISLRAAKKLVKTANAVLTLTPSKCSPSSVFACQLDEEITTLELEKAINAFRYYNCNAELGKRIAIWVAE